MSNLGAARNSDPETSHAAAASIDGKYLKALALRLIREAPDGMTIDELTDASGRQKVTMSPRLAPLMRDGLLIQVGKRPGFSGRAQIVWKVPG